MSFAALLGGGGGVLGMGEIKDKAGIWQRLSAAIGLPFTILVD